MLIEQRFRTKKLFSPRQVAEAIGVSESSLKRWCDAGHIGNQKTAGGHRRMSMADVVKFLRRRRMQLERPDILGLSVSESHLPPIHGDFRQLIADALDCGDQQRFSSLAVHLYLENWPIERILEEILAVAIPMTSRNWDLGNLQIKQECQVAEMCKTAWKTLRELIPAPSASALRAIGGCLSQFDYGLTAVAADLVFAEKGWNSRCLGYNLPISSICGMARQENPALVYIVVPNTLSDQKAMIEIKRGLNLISSTLTAGVSVVIAPNGTPDGFKQHLNSVSIVDNLSGMANLMKKHFVLPG